MNAEIAIDGGYTATCSLCDWTEWAASEPVAQAEAVWHVYAKHPAAWHLIAGPGLPRDPDPHTVHGRQKLRAAES